MELRLWLAAMGPSGVLRQNSTLTTQRAPNEPFAALASNRSGVDPNKSLLYIKIQAVELVSVN